MKSFNILLTCSSNKIQLIQWVKKSISKIDCKIKIFAGDTNSNVQSKYFCDQFWHMPSSVKDNYSTILSYCKKNNIKIIIPSSDRDLEFWSIYKNNLKKYKIFVMVSDHKTINSCFDKLKFYEKLKDLSFISYTSNNLNDFKKNQTLISKNRYGSGSNNIIVGKKEKLNNKNLSKKIKKNYIFQKYIKSKNEISIDCYFSKKNKLLKIVPRNRSLILNGESVITRVINGENFFTKINQIGFKLNFTGHIMFQGFIYNKKIIIFECNPRIGGASVMSLFNNMDSIYFFIIESLFPKLKININKKIFLDSKLLIFKNTKFLK
ncbi:ATP-grasp domain-containing protein [Candidatus Pelagibacter bacterium]|nr:ATP-grasp domain-containing protein [Candidatus Pelagibacter bacterium]